MKGDYQKKIKQCEKLGALQFQKVVFKVEDIKFKVLKKLWPNFLVFYDKQCDKKKRKLLKKAKTDEDRKRIIDETRKLKMAMRKEWHREQNRNYHMDMNKPTEMIYYLNWNKNIHKRGIIINAITIPLLTAATIAGIPFAIPFLIEELASAFINFQCINIQNYNIYRFQEREDTFKKMEARRMANNMQKHGEAAKVISKAMEKTEDIPTMKQIIEGIETKEQLEQLRSLVQATLAANQAANKNRGGK